MITRTHVLALVRAHPEFLAPLCSIDGPGGPEQYRLWPLQLRVLDAVLGSRKTIVLKARQLGVTWVLALYALWFVLTHPAQTVLVLSIGEREAKVVLRRVRRLYASLPGWLREMYPAVTDTTERFEIGHPEGPAAIVSLPSSGGRSETAHVLILDEGAHWEHTDERLAAVLPTAADAGRVVIASTANGAYGEFHRLWTEAMDWERVFIGADERPGRDADWIARERDSMGDLGPQELPLSPEEAFLASGRCAFDLPSLMLIAEHSCEPPKLTGAITQDVANVYFEPGQGDWQVWEAPAKGRGYVISADTTGGHGHSDFAHAVILDAISRDEVASLNARLEPSVFARELWKAGHLYAGPTGPALLVPESNNHGQAVVALLAEWGYPAIWEQEQYDQRLRRETRRLGWRTDVQSRNFAIASLQQGITEGTLGIRDAQAVREMTQFVWRETSAGNGRYEAAEGQHDDRVMAWAIAAAVLTHSARTEGPSETPVIFPGGD